MNAMQDMGSTRAMDHPAVTVESQADRTVATLLLRRVSGAPAEDGMWEMLAKLVTMPETKTLFLDCRQIQHFSSAGLGRLVTLAKQGRDGGGRVVLRNLCPSQLAVFRVLRLDSCLEIEPDRDPKGGLVP